MVGRSRHHQAHRSFISGVARQGQGAAVQEVDQGGVAQDQTVSGEVDVVRFFQIGNAGRDNGHGRHQNGVVAARLHGSGDVALQMLAMNAESYALTGALALTTRSAWS